jgi:hypothetical protein
MSIDGEVLTTVADRFPWASWAIWDDEFPDGECIEQHPERLIDFVSEHADHLTPDVVFLGLNRSDDLVEPFQNFHAPTRNHYDYRLKEFLQDGDLDRLHGAYMTDLVDEVNPESTEVEVTDADADVLLEQLRLFGEREYHVICFGNKPFDGLTDYFDAAATTQPPEIKYARTEVGDLTLHLYRVWFYGLYGIHQDKVETLQRQLQHIDERL